MKSALLILIASIYFIGTLDSGMKSKVENYTNYSRIDSLKIVKIDSVKDIYIVQASRNDSLFKFVSYKSNNNSECKKIIVGSCYDIELTSFFDLNYYLENTEFFVVGNEVVINLEEKTHSNLYSPNNLKGLCYMNNKSN
ncbi:MAG: hypothetical protein JKY22_02430 [Flavobacteriaceae bacterium]|nr:hypothetical protein [Flavobacteriaceae bacterium]